MTTCNTVTTCKVETLQQTDRYVPASQLQNAQGILRSSADNAAAPSGVTMYSQVPRGT